MRKHTLGTNIVTISDPIHRALRARIASILVNAASACIAVMSANHALVDINAAIVPIVLVSRGTG